MKNVIKLGVSALALTGGAFVAAPAMAQGVPTVSGNVSIVSDYRFRGVTLSDNSAALQGGIDLNWDNGFYIGSWGSTIQQFSSDNEFELDLYAGFGNEIGTSGLSYDVGVLVYTYPGSDDFDDTYYPEIYGSLSGVLGVGSWTVGAAYAPDTENLADDNVYLFANAQMPLGAGPFYATAGIGYEDGAFGSDKIDWSLGLGASVIGLDLGLSYVGYDSDFGDDDAIVASIGVSF